MGKNKLSALTFTFIQIRYIEICVTGYLFKNCRVKFICRIAVRPCRQQFQGGMVFKDRLKMDVEKNDFSFFIFEEHLFRT